MTPEKRDQVLKALGLINEKDKVTMKEYSVTFSTETTYYHKNQHYKMLKDALNYAKIYTKKNTLTSPNQRNNSYI